MTIVCYECGVLPGATCQKPAVCIRKQDFSRDCCEGREGARWLHALGCPRMEPAPTPGVTEFQALVDAMSPPAPLPSDPAARKDVPIATGFIDYFPDAVAAVAALSKVGNDQHNPGKPLHWDRSKSGDESDALMRHFMERGTIDTDGVRHSAKVAWRALALLQKELEAAR